MEPGSGVVFDDESEEESPLARARLLVCLYLRRLVGVAYVEDAVVAGVAPMAVRLRRALARVVLKEKHTWYCISCVCDVSFPTVVEGFTSCQYWKVLTVSKRR